MITTRPSGLKVAFVYDPKASYLEQGYSERECADLADDVTINGVSSALKELGHEVVPVPGIKSLVKHLAAGDQKDWNVVFNFSDGMFGSARESQVPGLLEAYQVPFTFSDAATLATCIDKGKTKMLLDYRRIPTSPFTLVPAFGEPVDLLSLGKQLSYPLFAKPVAASTSNGITPSNKIYHEKQLEPVVETLRRQFKDQEILLENFLSGREFTVAILGTGGDARVLGVSEVTGYNQDGTGHEHEHNTVDFATSFSKNGGGPGHDMDHVDADIEEPVVKRIAETALGAYKALGCRDGGRVDIRLSSDTDDAVPCVLEVNPIFGLRPDYSLFTWVARNNGMEYRDVIAEILANALQRSEPATKLGH